jgi:hypothetical protein
LFDRHPADVKNHEIAPDIFRIGIVEFSPEPFSASANHHSVGGLEIEDLQWMMVI